ncbi:polysaccharide biosynthesis protein [Streptomyces sp. R302]|uniref:Wzz/FepE/Etk N-terminal domain-containing protein n=1 Tax=unclassified Streptomyces TaxID=2593676 RepID=UPI00145EECA5|nr:MULTISPECIES: Wzz/FepE/Etk N-terminal domain-containing protein [unclassified Streptomyces]NML52592.1 polysaccharide biosynthesis protein [Streptomyces sp. R301]NML80479.1 polysaccharide biosynthesis protein [Streptomyces sp. R302]
MSDDTIRLVSLGRILRRRWRLLTLLALAGALVGHGTSLLLPPRYTTSVSVLLPGAWEERELLTQAQIATSSVVVDRVAASLAWSGVDGVELRKRITAEAAEGNIIRISGTADTPVRAQRLSDTAAREFVAFATRVVGGNADPGAETRLEALRRSVETAGRRITELADAADPGRTVESVQARTELEKLRTALRDAMTKLDETDPAAGKSGKVSMVVMGPAVRPAGEAPPTRVQLVVAGALLFFLLAVVGHFTAARMSRRPRTEEEIAAALGAVPVGSVDVPGGRPVLRPGARGPGAWLRRLLGLDVRWDVPVPRGSGDASGRRIRYRRVCARLRERLPAAGRLLVVVPDGDEIARRAAGELIAEAGSTASQDGGGPALKVVGVTVAHPLLPDRDGESGVVVVVSPGSWTSGELAGIAGACADARQDVVGLVVAGAVRGRPAGGAR